ncbi:DUF1513 domain-containing protein [Roseovarius sp. SCSIO 43702]|uniref:DUF1513 domain-containing protein n=1 Tax=Roseovarius sp. SCSIO 43702 TaxID=2823043 RepID=UPI001C73A24B|nr:DUF1513 domain-containing protein [Roseovarius sp. SCSIO 43702]QYX57588.1 DUF1513 domain-containing protein [Roseovarius sp. SCSIO 43702]
MPGRRSFLAGLLAATACPAPTWADAGAPRYLAAARLPSGAYRMFGLNAAGGRIFDLALPGRGHAAAAHPSRPEAVAFARRPGTFALVLDCMTGQETARLTAPDGHHFSGHGTFSAEGTLLFTAENDYRNARGMVGIWDAAHGYSRIGALPSGGVGPHDLRLMPSGTTLVVANGGIETHPDTGRAKLNLPLMRPNLAYLSLDGTVLDRAEPPSEWHKLSLRHLAVAPDGRVAVAGQWQGDAAETPPLLAMHEMGGALAFAETAETEARAMQGYAGSIAMSGGGDEIAITGPRGGRALVFDSARRLVTRIEAPDICGVAPARDGLLFTTGQGQILRRTPGAPPTTTSRHALSWDNHLMRV